MSYSRPSPNHSQLVNATFKASSGTSQNGNLAFAANDGESDEGGPDDAELDSALPVVVAIAAVATLTS